MAKTQIYPEVVHIGRIIRELRAGAINLIPETTLETRIEEIIGGGAPITSKALSVWGTKTAIIAAIGAGSESAREELGEYGIEFSPGRASCSNGHNHNVGYGGEREVSYS